MSLDNLKKFRELCAKNGVVMAKAKEIGVDNTEELIAYAGQEFDLAFSSDDIAALAKEGGAAMDELSDEDLDRVSGGKWIIPPDDE